MSAIIAIVGRPNVGKSTLFNRLAGGQKAIVANQPGVTRDRLYASALLHGHRVTLVDTGGFDPTSADVVTQGIAGQVQVALEQADVVLCVLDATAPPTSLDRESVSLLRRSSKPTVFVANKVDGPKQTTASDLYALGVGEIIPISAAHGRGIAQLEAALVSALPQGVSGANDETSDAETKIAIVGRPNAGKSSLFNHLTKSSRSLVTASPGTTRDPVDARIEFDGHEWILLDTAGVRRKSKVVHDGVESASVLKALRAMERADVAIVLCDATEGVTDQDQRLIGICVEHGRGVILGLNKIDLLKASDRAAAVEQARTAIRFASWVAIVPVSARTGAGLRQLQQVIQRISEQLRRRVPTAELNRFFSKVLEAHPPPTRGGRAPRIYYVTQAGVSPPLFVAVSNAPDHIATSFHRYVAREIRKAFGFDSVPLQLRFRARSESKSRRRAGVPSH